MELEVVPKLKTKKGYSLPNSYMVLYGLPTYSNWSEHRLDQNTWSHIYLQT